MGAHDPVPLATGESARAMSPIVPLVLSGLPRRARHDTIAAFVLIGIAIAMMAVPTSAMSWAGPISVDNPSLGGTVEAVFSLVLVAISLRYFWRGVRETGLQRLGVVLLGVGALVVCGDALRSLLEIAVLRQGWRPWLALDHPSRLLPVFWMYGTIVGYVTFMSVGAAGVVAALFPRKLVRERRRESWDRCVRRTGAVLSWLGLFALALMLLERYVLGDALVHALGGIVPSAEGPAWSPAVSTALLGLYLHLATLGLLQYLLGVWGAIITALLVVSIGEWLSGRFGDRWWRSRALVWLGAGAVTAGVIAALVIGAGTLDLLPRDGIGNLADIETWLGAVDAVWTGRVESLWVLFAATVVGVIVIGRIVTDSYVITDQAFEDESVTGWIRRRVPVDNTSPAIAAVWAPLAMVVVPLVIAFGAPVAGALTAVPEYFGDVDTVDRYWHLLSLAPSAPSVDAASLVVPVLLPVALLMFTLAVAVEGGRPALVTAGVALAATVIVAPALHRLEVLLLFGCVAVVGAAIAGADLSPEHWQLTALPVLVVAALAICYRISPDLPIPVLLAGSTLLQYGTQAQALNQPGDRRPDRLRLSLSLPLFLAGLALFDHTTSGLGNQATYSALGQQLALPIVGVSLALVLGLRMVSSRIDLGASDAESAAGRTGTS